MKKKIIFLGILLLSLFFVNNKNFVIKNQEKLATLFLDEKQEAITKIANMYYTKRAYIQYDQKKMDVNVDASVGTNRRQSNVSPDEISQYNPVYLDCSSFVHNVYREAFDYDLANILTSGSKTFEGFTTKNLANISSSAKVYRYNYDSDYTDVNVKEQLMKDIRNNLKTGDLLVIKKSNSSGHVMIYVDSDNDKGGYLIHATGNSYNYNSKKDNVENNNAIRKTSLETLFKTESNDHYLFPSKGTLESLTIIRPLNVINNNLSNKASKLKLSNYIDIQKYVNKRVSAGTQQNNTLTYTISIKNNSNKNVKVNINFPQPTNTKFVSEGKSNVTISKSGTKTITYKVKVLSNGTNVVDNGVTVNGIPLKPITLISKKKLASNDITKLRTAVSKYNKSNVQFNDKTFSSIDSAPSKTNILSLNDGKLISAIYYDAFKEDIKLEGGSQVFNSLFSNNGSTYTIKNDSSTISNMFVNNMYGGTRVQSANNNEKLNRIRNLSYNDLVTGDVLFELNGSTAQLYLYIDRNLITMDSNGLVKSNETESNKIIDMAMGSDAFAVLRPGYVLSNTTALKPDSNDNSTNTNSSSSSEKKIIKNNSFTPEQQKTFLENVNKYVSRINDKSITFSSSNRQLAKYPEDTKYLDSTSLIYNIYYSSFKIYLPAKSKEYFTSQYDKVVNSSTQISNLQVGDILVYTYGSNGVAGLYVDNNKILRYKKSGLSYQTIDEFKAECQTRPVSKFGVFRPVNNKELKTNNYSESNNTSSSDNKTIKNVSFTPEQQKAFLSNVDKYVSRINDKTITFSSKNRQLARYPEKTKYLDSTSLIYNIYYSSFKIYLPAKSKEYFTSQYDRVIKNYSQIKDLQIGDVLVYIYGSNNGVAGLYVDNNKILRYKKSGLFYQTIDEFQAECKTRTVSKFGVFRPVNNKTLTIREDKYVAATDISCNDSFTVNKNESILLNATVNPSNATNKELKYSSSNSYIATVDYKGKVKGIKAGKTKIKITSKENSKIVKEVTITVNSSTSSSDNNSNTNNNNSSISVDNASSVNISGNSSSVKFNSSSYTILKGHSIIITPKFNGSFNTVTYSTSRSGYIEAVSASNFKTVQVNGLKVGTTTLTVKLDNGKKASTSIIVKKNSDNKNVSFQKSSYSVNVGNSKTLTPSTITGNNSSITFTSSNPDCLDAQATGSGRSVVITGKSKCTTYLTASLSDGSTDKVKVSVYK